MYPRLKHFGWGREGEGRRWPKRPLCSDALNSGLAQPSA